MARRALEIGAPGIGIRGGVIQMIQIGHRHSRSGASFQIGHRHSDRRPGDAGIIPDRGRDPGHRHSARLRVIQIGASFQIGACGVIPGIGFPDEIF